MSAGPRWSTRTLLAAAVAFVVLLPWGLRNRHRYGELSFTDAHGGHTALVGANPNSDGRYSRSLNRLFAEGTPYALFAPPHRESDWAAYELAKSWTRLEPAYAVGLLAAKADRLLTVERPLLYWPLYRVSVLPEGSAVLRFFSEHRTGVERVVDGFWFALVATTLIGIVVAGARRNWMALSLLPLPLALIALYTLFFAEARYHLAIGALLMPFAGAGMTWLLELPRHRLSDRPSTTRLRAEAAFSALAVAVVFIGWPRLLAAGERLREAHRFAVCVCSVDGAKHVCAFRATDPAPGQGPSPVRGVWDGFGLRAVGPRTAAASDARAFAGKVPRLHSRRICRPCAGGERGCGALRRVGRPTVGSSGPLALARCRNAGHARGPHRARGRALARRSGPLSRFLACLRRARGTLDVDDRC